MAPSETDVIIIGGGTAGLPLAVRLSEDAATTVTVLEAGEYRPDDPRVNTPALWPALVGTDADWNFQTTSQVCDQHHDYTLVKAADIN